MTLVHPDTSQRPPTLGPFVRDRPRRMERLVETLLALAALLSVLTTIGIVLSLLDGTIAFLEQIPLTDFLFGTEWTPLFADGAYGVLPILSGTLLITGIAMVVAAPLGLGAALYLSEYASARARKLLKPVLEVLAGIPTVVFGFFAISFVTRTSSARCSVTSGCSTRCPPGSSSEC